MKALAAFVMQGFKQQAAYRVEGWLGIISSLIWFVLYAGIWTALLRGDPEALSRQMGYIIATRFLAELHFLPTWEVSEKFRQGDVGLELIKPVSLPVRILADFFGRSCFRLLRSVPVYVLIWAAFRLPAPAWWQVLLFLAAAFLGWVITATLQLALTLIALWTIQFDEAEQLFGIASSLFSGSFIPLYYLPGWVGAFAGFLPFAGIYFVPAAMLSGTLTGPALTQALVLQVVWALVGVGAIGAMWRAGSRKLVMQGG
ncbi:MAG TPA: ABC-2 family transporter protein [Symbiobacteriaceae bacterium]|nr:ABC-2 family transporter protein [Symbiobacteriaceae bacterium]